MRICLVGATHPCHNPRLIREADSLAADGHDVRVVAPSFMVDLRAKDLALLKNRKWRLETVDYCPGGLGNYRSFRTRGVRRAYAEIFAVTQLRFLADRAYVPALHALAKKAGSEPADWIIAHAHAALPAAAKAAKVVRARLGFDCEDLLSESPHEAAGFVKLIEEKYLGSCNYVSVPSEVIRNALMQTYGIPAPLVLYNVFPVSLLNGSVPPNQRKRNSTVRLYWFGQTIGEGRGIEDAIAAARLLGNRAEIHLRGRWAAGYEQTITSLADQANVKVVQYPPIPHDELIASMTEFDVGLALETADDPAYAKTVTNKLCSYFLAGLAVAATDTPGQREVLNQVPGAGFLYSSRDPESLAKGINNWIENREALINAQQAAWDAARSRFCWDFEKEKFFAALKS